jgi:hypothetical protein
MLTEGNGYFKGGQREALEDCMVRREEHPPGNKVICSSVQLVVAWLALGLPS